ncbi:MAG TPA: large conductance mechanosensitive channel protein MscL [Chitinophagaceae bacterium]|jgi:large conductance mechanosensitive channel|nr:large conductance mechanosensitive channel protein MscL [Chitinophagaceae bacterium]
MGFVKEFREFAMKGNFIDLAIGVVVGGAFAKIVDAFNKSIISPVLALVLGKVDLSSASVRVGTNTVFPYGILIQAIVDFIITAFVMFLLVKGLNRWRDKLNVAAAPTPSEILLTEIRDLLKK